MLGILISYTLGGDNSLGFGGTTIVWLFHVAKVGLLAVITLNVPYTFDYEISLTIIMIIGQGLRSSIIFAPLQGVCNQ
jgi:hypothetical protein